MTLKGYLRHKKDDHGNFLYDDQNNPMMELSPEAFAHALQALEQVGLPAVIRPSFTLGGTGGGIAYNREEFFDIVERGPRRLAHQRSADRGIRSRLEGIRDGGRARPRRQRHHHLLHRECGPDGRAYRRFHHGRARADADRQGISAHAHAPRIAVLREIGVETGGSNVQFAVNPADGRMVIIEMNPRVSRSSALASKATGFPIAKIAAKLAVGYTLDELQNDITKVTPASFEPTIDYVVTKIPRFAFEKFPGAEPILTTSMKSVGEAMAIGRTFAESLQKGAALAGNRPHRLRRNRTWPTTMNAIRAALAQPTPDRLRIAAQAMRLGFRDRAISRRSPNTIRGSWARSQTILRGRSRSRGERPARRRRRRLRRLKAMGFSDARLAKLDRPEGKGCSRGARARSACVPCSSASTPAPPNSRR